MRRNLLAGTSICLFALGGTTVGAADLGPPVFKAPPLAAAYWTGCYVGVHIGGGWGTTDFSNQTTALAPRTETVTQTQTTTQTQVQIIKEKKNHRDHNRDHDRDKDADKDGHGDRHDGKNDDHDRGKGHDRDKDHDRDHHADKDGHG